ncbi:MAG: hypothetical protein ABR500_00415 [Dermatophilaceae bacterium]|nr:hypothetical protein [Intrasporangiaceae bacterium]
MTDDFSFGTIPFDMERMAPFVETALARVPVTQGVGIRTLFCGPESFTPDLRPAVGEAPGIRSHLVCAGLNSVGILSSGGWGRTMAHWIATGDPGRTSPGSPSTASSRGRGSGAHREARTTEILGQVYAAHPPGVQLTTSRASTHRRSTTGSSLTAPTSPTCPAGREPRGSPAPDRCPPPSPAGDGIRGG